MALMNKYLTFLGLLLAFFILPCFADSPSTAIPLRVGVITDKPFAMKDGPGYQGLAIELWANVADANHWTYHYVPAGEDVYHAIQQLQAKKYDVLVGPISVNERRLFLVDFSRPFFINKVGVIIKKQNRSFISMLDDFLPRTLGFLIVVLACTFAVFLHLLWYFERGKHPEISLNYRHGISAGIWTHLFKKGFSHMPLTLHGKVTLLLWLGSLIVLFSLFNASVSAAFTVALAKTYDQVASFSDLDQLRVIGVEGVSATTLARNQGLALTTVATLSEAVAKLQANQADAIIYDALAAQQYLQANDVHGLRMSDFILGQEQYAFAVPYDSFLLKGINMALVKSQENTLANYYCQKYIGSGSTYCQL